MSSYIVRFNGQSKAVKNLGWFLRHWQDVDYIRVTKLPDGAAWMRAFMKQPTRDKVFYYFTTWASFNLCLDWLHRPVFQGLPLVIQDFDTKKLEHRVREIRVC